MELPALALTALLSYLLGAIPFGYLIARSKGFNIFEHGSGNIGATNVARVVGKKYGAAVFVLDALKGGLPVLAARYFAPSESSLPAKTFEVTAAVLAFLGHLFSIYLRFRGGKGVATGAGAVTVLLPLPALAALLVWILTLACTRYVAVASMAASTALCLLRLAGTRFAFDASHLMLNAFCVLVTVLVYVRHWGNVRRLLSGSEHRVKETAIMQLLTRLAHVLAMGLWFGMSVFFSIPVALSLFGTLEKISDRQGNAREIWFPMAEEFNEKNFTPEKAKRVKEELKLRGSIAQEQGSRAAGALISPMFTPYFVFQVLCGLVAVVTAFTWSWRRFPQRTHKARSWILLAALIAAAAGWWMEVEVGKIGEQRAEATDRVLDVNNTSPTDEEYQKAAAVRARFGEWHQWSLLLNLGTLFLVGIGMTLCASLPTLPKEENVSQPVEDPAPSPDP